MAEPIILPRDFTGHTFNQIAVDPDSKREVITQNANIMVKEAPDGTVCTQAEAQALLRMPEVSRHCCHLYAQRFYEELRARRVKRVYGFVQPAVLRQLVDEYGFHAGGETRPSPFGELVLVERWLP